MLPTSSTLHTCKGCTAVWCGCRAVAQLTELSIKRQVSKSIPWLSSVINTLGGPKLDMTEYLTAPLLIGELPWKAQDTTQEDMAFGADLIQL